MKSYNILKIDLSQEEKDILREAAAVVNEIVDLLIDNKANGRTPWQEETIVTNAFWELKTNFQRIDEEELLP